MLRAAVHRAASAVAQATSPSNDATPQNAVAALGSTASASSGPGSSPRLRPGNSLPTDSHAAPGADDSTDAISLLSRRRSSGHRRRHRRLNDQGCGVLGTLLTPARGPVHLPSDLDSDSDSGASANEHGEAQTWTQYLTCGFLGRPGQIRLMDSDSEAELLSEPVPDANVPLATGTSSEDAHLFDDATIARLHWRLASDEGNPSSEDALAQAQLEPSTGLAVDREAAPNAQSKDASTSVPGSADAQPDAPEAASFQPPSPQLASQGLLDPEAQQQPEPTSEAPPATDAPQPIELPTESQAPPNSAPTQTGAAPNDVPARPSSPLSSVGSSSRTGSKSSRSGKKTKPKQSSSNTSGKPRRKPKKKDHQLPSIVGSLPKRYLTEAEADAAAGGFGLFSTYQTQLAQQAQPAERDEFGFTQDDIDRAQAEFEAQVDLREMELQKREQAWLRAQPTIVSPVHVDHAEHQWDPQYYGPEGYPTGHDEYVYDEGYGDAEYDDDGYGYEQSARSPDTGIDYDNIGVLPPVGSSAIGSSSPSDLLQSPTPHPDPTVDEVDVAGLGFSTAPKQRYRKPTGTGSSSSSSRPGQLSQEQYLAPSSAGNSGSQRRTRAHSSRRQSQGSARSNPLAQLRSNSSAHSAGSAPSGSGSSARETEAAGTAGTALSSVLGSGSTGGSQGATGSGHVSSSHGTSRYPRLAAAQKRRKNAELVKSSVPTDEMTATRAE